MLFQASYSKKYVEKVKLLSPQIYPKFNLHHLQKIFTGFKGTLMQVWKSPYMLVFIQKQYPENFPFLILRILELFAREVCKFLKK